MIGPVFGDGRRCVGGATRRFYPVMDSGPGGTFALGPGIVAHTVANFSPSHHIAAFSTWNFQSWFRDPMGPCGNGFNLSNGLSVTFVP